MIEYYGYLDDYTVIEGGQIVYPRHVGRIHKYLAVTRPFLEKTQKSKHSQNQVTLSDGTLFTTISQNLTEL